MGGSGALTEYNAEQGAEPQRLYNQSKTKAARAQLRAFAPQLLDAVRNYEL